MLCKVKQVEVLTKEFDEDVPGLQGGHIAAAVFEQQLSQTGKYLFLYHVQTVLV